LLKRQILNVSNAVDAIEMRHRRKFLLFEGVPEVAGEEIADTVATICKDHLQINDATRNLFSICHRLGARSGGRPRSVLVRFSDLQVKNSVWRKKTALKGTTLVISEFMTRKRHAMFIAARKHFGMRNVWTLGGNIYIKLPDGKREHLSIAEQLEDLMSRYESVSNSMPSRVATQGVPATPGAVQGDAPAQASAASAPKAATLPAPMPVPSQPTRGAGSGATKKTEERRVKRAA
jgi:hypothetical protein